MKKMINWKRAAALFTSVMLMMASFCQTTFASGNIDEGKKICLTIDLESASKKASISLYEVGVWSGEEGKYVISDLYSASGASLEGEDSSKMLEAAKKLKAYAEEKKIAATATKATESGKVEFTNLKSAVYLICQNKGVSDNVTITPYLIKLPMVNPETNEWEYEVVARPKNTSDTSGGNNSSGGGSSSGGGGGGRKDPTPTSAASTEPTEPSVPDEPVIELEPTPFDGLAKTGDRGMMLETVIFAVSACGILGLVIFKRRSENR